MDVESTPFDLRQIDNLGVRLRILSALGFDDNFCVNNETNKTVKVAKYVYCLYPVYIILVNTPILQSLSQTIWSLDGSIFGSTWSSVLHIKLHARPSKERVTYYRKRGSKILETWSFVL